MPVFAHVSRSPIERTCSWHNEVDNINEAEHHQITTKERQPLLELRTEKSIKILAANNGRATVIKDTDKYEQKVTTML